MRWGFSLTHREYFPQLFSGLGIVCNLWFSRLRDSIRVKLAFTFRGPRGWELIITEGSTRVYYFGLLLENILPHAFAASSLPLVRLLGVKWTSLQPLSMC